MVSELGLQILRQTCSLFLLVGMAMKCSCIAAEHNQTLKSNLVIVL